MGKKYISILLAIVLIFSCMLCYAEADATGPIPIQFEKTDGQYIYCNNPEYVGESDLSTDENPNATYMMKCEGLQPDTYSVFFCFYNWTTFAVEPDMEFKTDGNAVIRIDSVSYCLPVGDEYWDCINTWADFLNMNIRTINGYQQYVPYQGITMPREIQLNNSNDWISKYIYNYAAVQSRLTFNMLVKFTVLSGEVDVNFAALKHYDVLGDRSHHNPDALPGKYRRDTSIKGIEQDSLPMVTCDLNVEITPDTVDGEPLPVEIFNQYYNEGNVVEHWMTNINPSRDAYLYSKQVAAGSDMLTFSFEDDSKLQYYGKNVPESQRDNVWVFDIYHHDTTEYESGMSWKKEDHIPNDFTSETLDIENLPNLDYEFNLGNFGVTNRYYLTVHNSDHITRYINYYLETSLSSNIVIARDEKGDMLNPYTLQPVDAFALCKGINSDKVNECMLSAEVAAGDTVRYIIDVILPTNCYGGMVNSLVVDKMKRLMPVAGNDFPNYTELYPYEGVFFNGEQYMKWEGGGLYRYNNSTWEQVNLPESAKKIFQYRSGDFKIVKMNKGYAARFAGWDGGLDWCIAYTNTENKVFFFDENFNYKSTRDFQTYIYDIVPANGKVYINADKIYETTDGLHFSQTTGKADFPKSNGTYAIVRNGGQLYLRDAKEDIKISYESHPVPSELSASGGIFYYRKSWKEFFTDTVTPNILSVSPDGVYWTDFELPNTFLELMDVHYIDNKLFVNGRFQTMEFNFQLQTQIKVVLNHEMLGFDVPPTLKNDRTMLPIRYFFEKLGAKVNWNGETEEIIVTQGEHTIVFQLNNQKAMVDGAEKELDTPPYLENDKTMIPVRFLTENLGYKVEWNEKTNTATITKN